MSQVLSPAAFAWLADFLKAKSGLVLGPDKQYLLDSRLLPIARVENCPGLEGLVAKLRAAPSGKLATDVIEAMTTNESFFFRDGRPFDHFKSALPRLLAGKPAGQTLRIWSAACSTGQEPYSLAMLLTEAKAQLAGRAVEIVGTDLSAEVLARAKDGLYTQFEVQRGLPVTHLVKYFTKDGANWKLKDSIRSMVTWRLWNLLDDCAGLGRFDVVYCRNVLIYFDQTTKGKVLDSIARTMPADGLLYLGGAETVLGITQKFEPLAGERGVYCPTGGAALHAAGSGAAQPPALAAAIGTAASGPRPASPIGFAGSGLAAMAGAALRPGVAAVGSRST
jgi:chemotaxis protein methyltransferase CheR